jgi:hypothetical protein
MLSGGHPSDAKQRVLVLSFSDLRADARVRRQLALLAHELDVTAIACACPTDHPVHCVAVPGQHWKGSGKAVAALLLAGRRYEAAYRSSSCVQAARDAIRGHQYDLLVANDMWTLPLALEIKGKAKLLLDAHEYAPLEFEESRKWRFFFRGFNEYLCRRYLPLADAATTVCEGIAREYQRTFGVRMSVINNAPPYQDLIPTAARVNGKIRLVHHGGAVPSRQLEAMIEAMRHLDARFTLDFVLMPTDPRYLARLRLLASADSRIGFLPPVTMHELPRVLNGYDAGIYLLPPNNFNNRFSLPNKFFDFVQARLAVVVGPSPEMASLVKRHGFGAVSADFSPVSFATAIGSLTPEKIAAFKVRAHEAARELCFEKSAETLRSIVHQLVAQ